MCINVCERIVFPWQPHNCKLLWSCGRSSAFTSVPAGINKHKSHQRRLGLVFLFFSLSASQTSVQGFALLMSSPRFLCHVIPRPPFPHLVVISFLTLSSPSCRVWVCQSMGGFGWPLRRRCSPCQRPP